MCGFLISGCGGHHPAPWASAHGLFILEGAWSDTFDFCFRWLLSHCPLWTTWGSGASIVPPIPWGPHAHLLAVSFVFPGLLFVSFTWLVFLFEAPLRLLWVFSGTLAWRVLGLIQRVFLENSRRSLAHLTSFLLLRSILFTGRSPWPRKPLGPGLLARRTAWPAQGACRTQHDWYSRRRDLFWLLDRIRRSEVLANSRPSSLRLAAVTGLVVARCWRRRSNKVLVLAMAFYPASSYLISWLVV